MHRYRRYTFPSVARVQAAAQTAQTLPDSDEPLLPELDPAVTEGLLEEARQAGYDAGYSAGHDSGYAAAEQAGAAAAQRSAQDALAALSEPLETLMAGFAQVQRDYQAGVRSQIVELVGKVVRQVVRDELETRPEQVLVFVDEALAAMPQAPEAVEVRLNAEEYRRIAQAVPEYAQRWKLIPDARLAAGEGRVKAGEYEMDVGCGQRLTACLEQIATHLAAADEGESLVSSGESQ